MTRILAMATHRPRPEHRGDLVAAMAQVKAAATDVEGLESIGAYASPDTERIVAVSIWSSLETMQAGMQQVFGSIGPFPFDVWETEPHSLEFLPEAIDS